MSLINKALQQEQQRRNINFDACPPMVTRAMRRQGERGPALLLAFAAVGLLIAGGTTAFFYFGASYLGDVQVAVASPEQTSPHAAALATIADDAAATATAEPIATVRKMLDEQAIEPLALETPDTALANADQPDSPAAEKTASITETQIQTQAFVDKLSVQGVRNLGPESRVFLSGKIRKIGDMVDLATGLTLARVEENQLIFEDRDGFRYTKTY